MSSDQHTLSLVSENPPLPEGFAYSADVLSDAEERDLVRRIRVLSLEEFVFHGFTARRRSISFGWHYGLPAR